MNQANKLSVLILGADWVSQPPTECAGVRVSYLFERPILLHIGRLLILTNFPVTSGWSRKFTGKDFSLSVLLGSSCLTFRVSPASFAVAFHLFPAPLFPFPFLHSYSLFVLFHFAFYFPYFLPKHTWYSR